MNSAMIWRTCAGLAHCRCLIIRPVFRKGNDQIRFEDLFFVYPCVYECIRACVCQCVRACVWCARVCVHVHVYKSGGTQSYILYSGTVLSTLLCGVDT